MLAAVLYILIRQRLHHRLLPAGSHAAGHSPASLQALDLNAVLARSNHQLRQRERELNEAQRLAHIGSWEWHMGKNRVTWSEEMYRIYRHDLMKPVPNFAEQQALYHAESWRMLKRSVEKCLLTGEPYALELKLTGAGDEVHTILAHGEPERDEAGKIVLIRGTAQDITDRKKLEDALSYQATHDSLTGLPNRTLLIEALDAAVAEGNRLGLLTGVLYLDADNFKDLNDTLGHHAGDCFLKRLAERLGGCVAASDTIARIGGDEFAVICTGLSSVMELETIVSCLLMEVRKPVIIDGTEFHGSVSLGVAVAPRDGKSAADLLRNADVAMYQAKRFSRDAYVFFAPEMIQKLRNRVDTEKHLRLALEHREFCLYYQPRIDLLTGAISGAEALIRWHHPVQGRMLPGEFIDVAETSGLIVPIGDWVLNTACEQARRWLLAGRLNSPIAVNVSIAQLKRKSFVASVETALRASGLAPALLELEITESLLLEDAELFARQLQELKELGVRIAIDDFGTRYSNFNYLKQMPIDTLKIDRSFVRDIDISPGDAAICRSIIALAHNLHLRSVGEGVERRSELDCLRQFGCDDVQGFLLARPLPPEEIELFFDASLDYAAATVSRSY